MTDDLSRRAFAGTVATATALLAGCTGGGDGGDDDGTESPTASPTDSGGMEESPTDEPTDEPTDTPTPAEGTPSDPDQTVVVGPGGSLVFDPESFEIPKGGTVLWVWDSAGHNVSPGSQPSGADWPGKDDSTYGGDTTYAYTFETAGTYEYHCDPHQSAGMVGSFTVTE